uniref:Proteasome subunit alpha type n=1 Tax=Chromera velia CCMP2878 TaxID=1169474 RepID=A0A0G4FX30_9ALVE|eukprot:Cvel_19172.t1-p1 / transcript=Cvel_19172.t1 / gene=Cvel_19172 / organism=Chromera_velia_CCMP2878 / gene_product=Proteasome subunit alpha type-3, putative / transcript_product=Proteasome subunit alpha type-3, putative / location=Cvel_scaffold1634:7064-7810(+) / protein_length=249 / sequence_SO=supercontig / SO=protein_coding / is_pseudo=false
MAGVGSGYDLSVSTFSPDGRVFQVEYASKAVENSGTCLGLVCKDGVVMGVEKFLLSKMLIPGTNKRIYAVDKHIGISVAGLVADARQIVDRARHEASNYKSTYGESIPPRVLSERVAMFVHAYTLYWSVRPFGCAVLIGAYDPVKGPELYCVEPAGTHGKFFGFALGKAHAAAKTEVEKLKLSELTCREAVYHVCKIIHQVHDENKDKEFEVEVSWICEETGWTHAAVPPEFLKESEERAKKTLDEMDD